jgi:hypothetical protein
VDLLQKHGQRTNMEPSEFLANAAVIVPDVLHRSGSSSIGSTSIGNSDGSGFHAASYSHLRRFWPSRLVRQ